MVGLWLARSQGEIFFGETEWRVVGRTVGRRQGAGSREQVDASENEHKHQTSGIETVQSVRAHTPHPTSFYPSPALTALLMTTDCVSTGGADGGGAARLRGVANRKGASEQLKREKRKSCSCCARIR